MNIIQYIIIEAEDIISLESKVMKAVNEGLIPLGGLAINPSSFPVISRFNQAMIRYETK